MAAPPAPNSERRRLALDGMLAVYAALIVYGSLYPLVGWDWARWAVAVEGLLHWPRHRPRADMITNLLVYVPLGALILARLGAAARPWWWRLLGAVAICALASLVLELGQAALPSRVASLRDLTWNSLGAACGAGGWLLCSRDSAFGRGLDLACRRWLRPGLGGSVGLLLLLVWVLVQWLPLSVDFNPVRLAVETRRLAARLLDPGDWRLVVLVAEAALLLAAGLLWHWILRPGRGRLLGFAALAAVVLGGQILLVDRHLTAERALGCALALIALAATLRRPQRAPLVAILALLGSFLLFGTYSPHAWGLVQRDFNWVPFVANIGRLHSLPGLVEIVWVFAMLGYWASQALARQDARLILGGGAAVLALSAAVEWVQIGYPDRWPDVTDPLLALSGWLLPFWLHTQLSDREAGQGAPAPPTPGYRAEPDGLTPSYAADDQTSTR